MWEGGTVVCPTGFQSQPTRLTYVRFEGSDVVLSTGVAGLLVHGGAWNIPDNELAEHRDGLQEAIAVGGALMKRGAPALEVVTEVVASLEQHGGFDAGRGAVLTKRGEVELDAGVMDGATMHFGGVAATKRLASPIRVARVVAERGDGQARLLVSDGAELFAESAGFELVENGILVCDRERRRYAELSRNRTYHTSQTFMAEDGPRGTVGCVARDRSGNVAAATSTGGTPFRPSFRVGDTPIPGAGFYANANVAASATGWGEAIATVLLCGRAVFGFATDVSVAGQIETLLTEMGARVRNQEGAPATGGLIALSVTGHGGWGYTTPRMARGGWDEDNGVWLAV